MILKPLHNNVVLLPMVEENISRSGIVISQTQQKPQQAKVIAVGSGIDGKAMSVKKNDLVVFNTYAGVDFCFENKNFVLINEQDIIAKID